MRMVRRKFCRKAVVLLLWSSVDSLLLSSLYLWHMAGTCTTQVPDSVCIPTDIDAELFHNGPAPQGFAEQIRQAILMWPFSIPGLLGIGSLEVTEVPDDGSTPAPVTPAPVTAPTPAPIAGSPVVGIQDRAPSGGDSVNPGAFVAAGVAGLILIIVALFVVRRRRNSDESLSKHRELGDDEDDGGLATDEDDETMQNVTIDSTPPRKSYVVGEDESLRSWDSRHAGADGQEVYVASPAMDFQHSPHHECSSPTCEACEKKRQQGTKFVMADSGIDTPTYLPAESDRNYEQEDTVDL